MAIHEATLPGGPEPAARYRTRRCRMMANDSMTEDRSQRSFVRLNCRPGQEKLQSMNKVLQIPYFVFCMLERVEKRYQNNGYWPIPLKPTVNR